MRIRLNLATTPVKNDNRFVFGATIIGIIAVIALFGLAWRAYGVRKADEARRTEIAQLQNEITQLNIRRAGVEGFFNDPRILDVRDRSAFLNELIQERSFPWTRIFMDLEHLLPVGVRVTKIAPKLVAGHVELNLTVGANSDEAGSKFLKALEGSPSFSHVALSSETRSGRSADGDLINFDLTAWYLAS
ncbi:MAG TPA: PilN domain-containing protein [Candidatus Acidoferrales bacterium]|nr:PilN domain-containing protein [Candidatus Acidoferrales bacterium]